MPNQQLRLPPLFVMATDSPFGVRSRTKRRRFGKSFGWMPIIASIFPYFGIPVLL